MTNKREFRFGLISINKDDCLGGLAFVIARASVAPLMNVELLMQLQSVKRLENGGDHCKFTGAIDCFQHIWCQQGIAGFWRDYPIKLVYDAVSYCLRKFLFRPEYFARMFPKQHAGGFLSYVFCSIGGLCILFPFNAARMRFLSDTGTSKTYNGTIHCLVSMSTGPTGFRSLYAGLGLACIGSALNSILFLASSRFSTYVVKKLESSGCARLDYRSMMWGATMAAATVNYPLVNLTHVCMVHQDEKIGGTLPSCRKLVAQVGIIGLFEGFTLNIVQVVSFKLIQDYCRKVLLVKERWKSAPKALSIKGVGRNVDGTYKLNLDFTANRCPTWEKKGSEQMVVYSDRWGRWAVTKPEYIKKNRHYARTSKKHWGRHPDKMQWGKLKAGKFEKHNYQILAVEEPPQPQKPTLEREGRNIKLSWIIPKAVPAITHTRPKVRSVNGSWENIDMQTRETSVIIDKLQQDVSYEAVVVMYNGCWGKFSSVSDALYLPATPMELHLLVEALPGKSKKDEENETGSVSIKEYYREGDVGTVAKMEGLNHETDQFQIIWHRTGLTSVWTGTESWVSDFKIVGHAVVELGARVQTLPIPETTKNSNSPNRGTIYTIDANEFGIVWDLTEQTSKVKHEDWPYVYKIIGKARDVQLGDRLQALPGQELIAQGVEYYREDDFGTVTAFSARDDGVDLLQIEWHRSGLTTTHLKHDDSRLKFVGKAQSLVPRAPKITGNAHGRHSFRVTWGMPTSGGLQVRGSIVNVRVVGESWQCVDTSDERNVLSPDPPDEIMRDKFQVAAPTSSILIHGIRYSVAYEARVAMRTSAGWSEYSSESDAITVQPPGCIFPLKEDIWQSTSLLRELVENASAMPLNVPFQIPSETSDWILPRTPPGLLLRSGTGQFLRTSSGSLTRSVTQAGITSQTSPAQPSLVEVSGLKHIRPQEIPKNISSWAWITVGADVTPRTSGRFYHEVKLKCSPQGPQIGWVTTAFAAVPLLAEGVGDDNDGWAADGVRGCSWHGGDSTPVIWPRKWAFDDVVGCALDLNAGQMHFSLNGEWVSDATLHFNVGEHALYPALSMKGGFDMHICREDWKFPPPQDGHGQGYLPWADTGVFALKLPAAIQLAQKQQQMRDLICFNFVFDGQADGTDGHNKLGPPALISADRKNVLNSLFIIAALEPTALLTVPKVLFVGEPGADAGGLLYDWADTTASALGSPNSHASAVFVEGAGEVDLNGEYMLSVATSNSTLYNQVDGDGELGYSSVGQTSEKRWCLSRASRQSADRPTRVYMAPTDSSLYVPEEGWQLFHFSQEPCPVVEKIKIDAVEYFAVRGAGEECLNGNYKAGNRKVDGRPYYLKVGDENGLVAWHKESGKWFMAYIGYKDSMDLFSSDADIDTMPLTGWKSTYKKSKEPAPRVKAFPLPQLFTEAPDGGLMPMPKVEFEDSLREPVWRLYLGVGRFLGLCLFHRIPLPLTLNRIALKLLLHRTIVPLDVANIDPEFYDLRLTSVLKPGGLDFLKAVLALDEPLTFLSASTPLRPDPSELVPGGGQRHVTEENKEEYVQLLCEDYVLGGIRTEIALMLHGFSEIIPEGTLQDLGISCADLSQMLCGHPSYDVDDWKKHTKCNAADDEPVKEFFFQALQLGDENLRGKVLQFVTGASRVPGAGFQHLQPPFTLHVYTPDKTSASSKPPLPTAHTCTNTLDLPRYANLEELQERLECAVEHGEGFGFR